MNQSENDHPSGREAARATHVAQGAGVTLRSSSVGALPIVNRILERMKLDEWLDAYLPMLALLGTRSITLFSVTDGAGHLAPVATETSAPQPVGCRLRRA